MVESRNELLMEIASRTGLDLLGEDEDDEEEEEDANDGGDAAAPPPPIAMPPPPAPLLSHLRRLTKKALWRRSPSKKSQCHMGSS
jgi:hypothetical protein